MTDTPKNPAAPSDTSQSTSSSTGHPAERPAGADTAQPGHDDGVLESLGKAISSPIIGTAELEDDSLPKPGDKR